VQGILLLFRIKTIELHRIVLHYMSILHFAEIYNLAEQFLEVSL